MRTADLSAVRAICTLQNWSIVAGNGGIRIRSDDRLTSRVVAFDAAISRVLTCTGSVYKLGREQVPTNS